MRVTCACVCRVILEGQLSMDWATVAKELKRSFKDYRQRTDCAEGVYEARACAHTHTHTHRHTHTHTHTDTHTHTHTHRHTSCL